MENTNKYRVNHNMSRKDLFNAERASKDVKTAIDSGEVFTVTGCAIVADGGTSKAGEVVDVGYIATTAGVFGFTSSVMIKAIYDLVDYLIETAKDGEPCEIRFFAGMSKGGSEYYNFEIV